jgi:probable O-glycosylation ligase (exosortase A-associated)
MRDLLLFAVFALSVAAALRRPSWGALAWVGFGIVNPHRAAWGLAYSFPFALGIGLVTVIGALFSKEPKRLKGGAATAVLILFIVYMAFTTFFALVPDRAWDMLDRVVKIQLGTFLVLTLLYRKDQVIALIWVIALSIGFYAVKGGLFTLATMGAYRVWGPPSSFIEENNALALATIISIPLWAFLFTQYKDRTWIRAAILAAIALSVVSAIGSHSRGGVVAIAAMAVFFWLKSRMKVALGVLMVVAAFGIVAFMPASWEDRVATITDPRADASANARLETWTMLYNLAKDRPFTGGGYQPYESWIVQKYNPVYEGVHVAHSIYFQVLGEHGFVAFFLFLLFWALVWRMCSQVVALSRDRDEHRWAFWLAEMTKVSMVAYLVGGAFLSLAHWDVPYYLFVAIAITRSVLKQAAATQDESIQSEGSALTDASAVAPSG